MCLVGICSLFKREGLQEREGPAPVPSAPYPTEWPSRGVGETDAQPVTRSLLIVHMALGDLCRNEFQIQGESPWEPKPLVSEGTLGL